MKRFLPVFITAIFLIFLSACDVSGNILSPAEKEQLYSVEFRLLSSEKTISGDADAADLSKSSQKETKAELSDGSSLMPGDSFSVSCKAQSPESQVSAVLVTLESADTDIASVLFLRNGYEAPASLKSPSLSALPSVLGSPLPVSLPEDLKPGIYLVRIDFFEKNAQVFEKNLNIFVLSSPPSVDSIQVCPASVSPGTSALVQAKVGYPADSRPYLVWRFGSDIIGSGLLSEGLDQFLWKSPLKEGVYGLKLSVYPFPPAGDLPFAFDSQVTRSAKIVVAVQAADTTDPFQESDDFYSLLHFSGNFDDSGYREAARKLLFAGLPRASVMGVNFGYQFDAERSLAFSEYLLPVKEGRLGAFSVMGRFTVSKKAAGDLFRSESSEPGFSLSLGLDESGQYVLSLSDRNQKIVSSSGIIADGRVHDLIVSLTPYENGYRAQWFLDYKAQTLDELAISFKNLPSSGRAFLGGQGAVQAVIDEFGIYASTDSSDSPSGAASHTQAWTRAYFTLMSKTYREKLLWAEGFDGKVLPEYLETAGAVSLDSGALLLDKASSVSIPIAGRKEDAIQVDIKLRPESGKGYSLSLGPKGSPAVRISPDGAIQWADGSEKASVKASSLNAISPSLRLEFSSGACFLVSEKQRIELFPLDGKEPSLSLRLEADSPVAIESLLVRRLSDIELLAKRDASARRVGAAVFKSPM